jgi:hypothetical protein
MGNSVYLTNMPLLLGCVEMQILFHYTTKELGRSRGLSSNSVFVMLQWIKKWNSTTNFATMRLNSEEEWERAY